VWGSLLPIVAGCSLSALKEVSFSWGGFNNAMISNLGMVLRNIYSKKSLNDYKASGGGLCPRIACALAPHWRQHCEQPWLRRSYATTAKPKP
jgi:hypothetical protein